MWVQMTRFYMNLKYHNLWCAVDWNNTNRREGIRLCRPIELNFNMKPRKLDQINGEMGTL